MSQTMTDWKITDIWSVCKVESGWTPSTKKDEYWNWDISRITPKDLSNHNDVFISVWDRSITREWLNNSSAKLLPKNTILFSSRAPIWYVAIASNEVSTNQWFKNLVCDEETSHYKFFYYLMIYRSDYIERIAWWSTFSEASWSLIKSIEINLPPLPEQQAIASVLSSFDDKIELLREQNETLEKIAQTLFKEWFGKYSVDNYPDWWRVYKLSEICNTVNWYSYKWSELVEESDKALVTLKSFDRSWWFQTRWFKPFDWSPKETQRVWLWDLVVAHTDLTQDAEVLGNPALIFDDWWFDEMFITMDLVKVISTEPNISLPFLFYIMSSRYFKWHCKGYANGTTVLHLTKKAIPEYELALPKDLTLVKEFSDLASLTRNKISKNNIQINSLSKTRDALLPKLMSGKVRVRF